MIKKYLALLSFTPMLFADTIGGEVSLGILNHSPSGSSSYQSNQTVDIADTLNLSTTQDIFIRGAVEHPIPLIPNIKFTYHTFSYQGNNSVNDFSWGLIENISGKIESDLSVNYTDTTLYYELLDNWVEVDAGVTLRYINGDMSIKSLSKTDKLSYSTFTPLLYGQARFNIPSTDLILTTQANVISFSGITAYDYELSARYFFTLGAGIEVGYKSFHIDSDELSTGLKADMDFSGAFAAVVWDF